MTCWPRGWTASCPDALKLTAKEQELERVPFKSYVYENENAKYKRGSDKVIRSSEIGAGVFVLCNTRFCALYRTASLVEDAETVSAFETPYDAIAGVTYVAAQYETMRLTVETADTSFTAIVPNDALMDDFSNRLKTGPVIPFSDAAARQNRRICGKNGNASAL